MFEDVPHDWTATWESGEGRLSVTLESQQKPQFTDFLQWTAVRNEQEHLTIRMRFPPLHHWFEQRGDLTLFVGRRLPTGHPYFAEGYTFGFKSAFGRTRFSKQGELAAAEEVIRTSWLDEAWRVEFDVGHFRVLSERLFPETWMLTEFEDTSMQWVDVVGLLASARLLFAFDLASDHLFLDEIVLWGLRVPDHNPLAVQPSGNLVSTWAQLKRFWIEP